jgi:meckelin
MVVYAVLATKDTLLKSFQPYQFFANFEAIVGYRQDVFYRILQDNVTGLLGRYEYASWPLNGLFLEYQPSPQFSYLTTDRYITSAYQFREVTQFWLARYSWKGEFKGLHPLTLELNQCREKNELSQLWRRFGTNYEADCVVDVSEFLNEKDSTDFFEPFFEDGTDNGRPNIRPLPVIVRWFWDNSNTEDDQTNWRAARRFYLLDNYSNRNSITFINSIKIYFNIRADDSTRIYPPYFVINRTTIQKSAFDEPQPPNVHRTKASDTAPRFEFIVNYAKDMGLFEQWFLIFPIILAVFAFLFAISRIVLISHVDGVYEYATPTIVRVLCVAFDTVAIYFWLVSAGFSCFQFVVFKWQKVLFWCMPPESFPQFVLLRNFLITALAASILSVLLRVFCIQTQSYVFFLDWESPRRDTIPISAWRRINVANEWSRVMSVRSYSIVFTLVVLVLILDGFHARLMANPVPTEELLDLGSSHFVLKYGLDSFLWLILIAAQYLWCHYIYWRLVGNPYFNFLDLCSMSNISVFITTSDAHGFYLHGRSVHSHADVDMKKLSQSLVDEQGGLVGLRGLLAGQTEQVFECFFAREFRQHFAALKTQITIQQRWFAQRNEAKEIPQAVLQSYQDVNKYLKTFFDRSAPDNKFVVEETDMVQKFFGQPPQTSESRFTPIKDSTFKVALLAGAEWHMMLMYALLFAVIDWSTDAPAIAAFTVYIADFIIVWFYGRVARAFLARSALLDSRFILS